MAHPLDSAGSAYDDVFNDLSTAGSMYNAHQSHQQAQQQAQQLQVQQQQIMQLQQQLKDTMQMAQQNNAGRSQNQSLPLKSMTQSMVLPSTSSGLTGGAGWNSLSTINQGQVNFHSSVTDTPLEGITPTGNIGAGDFLSQLGKTWNLIQSKAQELDAAKRKHRKVAKSLTDVQAELETLRARESAVTLRVSELESNSLVLTSENARLKREIGVLRDGQNALEARVESTSNELFEKNRENQTLKAENDEHMAVLEEMRSKERGHAADNEDLRSQLERARQRAEDADGRAAKASESSKQTVADLHREKSELSTHLWHVMEELKASERRANELEENYAEKVQALERRAAEVTRLSGEKRDVEQAFASLKSEVSETLGAMQREHAETQDKLRSSKSDLAHMKKAMESCKRELKDARKELNTAKKQGAEQIKKVREEANRASSDADALMRTATEEHAESMRNAKDALSRATRSKEQLQEALDAKREELRAARDETAATRRRCKEMESKIDRLGKEHRDKMDSVQDALRGREEELGKTRSALSAAEDRARTAEDRAQASLAAKIEQACVDAEERLGAKIASLNNALNEEGALRAAAEKETNEAKDILEKAKMQFAEQRKGLEDACQRQVAEVEERLQEEANAHQTQKESLVKRVAAVDQSFKSFKEKSRAQISSLTENVAAQTKQLSQRIAECEKLRNENSALQSKMAEDGKTMRSEYDAALTEKLDALQSAHEETVAELRSQLEAVRKESSWGKDKVEELSGENDELRTRMGEASEQIQKLESELGRTIKDCAAQILAFNERNEGITKELQDIVAERSSAKAELAKKNAIVEDAVATITELRNELQCAEEDAESTIMALENKVAASESTRSELEEQNKQLAMQVAKGTSQHNEQVSMLEKALSESHWELDSLKRHMANLKLDKQSLEDRLMHLKRDNESLKKVEKNMGSFLKSVMGNRGTPNAESAAIVSAVAKGVKPLNMEKAANSGYLRSSDKTSQSRPKSGIRRGAKKDSVDRPSASNSDSARSIGSNASTMSTTRSRDSRESSSSRSIDGDNKLNLPSVQTSRSADNSSRSTGDKNDSNGLASDMLPSLTSSRSTASSGSSGSSDTQIAADVIARTAQFLKARHESRPGSRQGERASSEKTVTEEKIFTKKSISSKKKKLASHASKENSRNGSSRTLHKSTRGSSASVLGVRALKQHVRRATSAHPKKRTAGSSRSSSKKKKDPFVSRPGSAPARQTPKRVHDVFIPSTEASRFQQEEEGRDDLGTSKRNVETLDETGADYHKNAETFVVDDDDDDEHDGFVMEDDDEFDENGEEHPLDKLNTANKHLYRLPRPESASRRRRLSAQRRQHHLKHQHNTGNAKYHYAPSPGSAYISQSFDDDTEKPSDNAISRNMYRRSVSAKSFGRSKARTGKEYTGVAQLHEIYGGTIGNNGSLSSRRRENDHREAMIYEQNAEEDSNQLEQDILNRHRSKAGARSAGPKLRKTGLTRSKSMEGPSKRRIQFR